MTKKLLAGLTAGLFVIGIAGFAQALSIERTFGYFDVTFYNTSDTNGYVTGGGDWTATQMNDVGSSLLAWNRIQNSPGRNVQVDMFWTELDIYGTSILGGSSSIRVGDGNTIWNAGEYVWKEGQNLSTPFDTLIQFDITAANTSWNFGQNHASGGEIDFRSVTSHEIGHSLGWSSTYNNNSDDFGLFGSDGYMGISAWDANLIDEDGNRPATGPGGGDPNNFNETGDVYFDGANASALYGGPVPIYSPNGFQPGSSLSHLDEGALGEYLMSPSFGLGQTIRDVSDLEWDMMTDMGWDIVETPEPATMLLFGTGLAGLAGARIRKKKKQQ